MYFSFFNKTAFIKSAIIFLLIIFYSAAALAQSAAVPAAAAAVSATAAENGKALYDQIKACQLTGGSADVSGLVLKRDRVTMNFTGTFYFTAPAGGKVTGAVFIGNGTMHADTPPNEFEKSNVKRLLGMDAVESDFHTAVLRFTDDTFDIIGKDKHDSAASGTAQKLISDNEARILKETGVNLSSRVALSILNAESPGFFFANFDGGSLGRFSYVFDPQNRIPTSAFDVNGGEKGIIFAYRLAILGNEIWLAFPGLDDFKNGTVYYSDINDIVNVTNYKMTVDLRNPKVKMGLKATISMTIWNAGVRAIPFSIGESLGESENQRLKKQLRIRSARIGSTELNTTQEDWESSLTVFLPEPSQANQKIDLELELEGDFLTQPDYLQGCCSYPRSNESWYPRHGYLDRATYDLTFLHQKKHKVASVGVRQSETPDPQSPDTMITRYVMKQPIALATFALGPWERHSELVKLDNGQTLPIEFNSLSGDYMELKEDFILAEMNNSIRYFQELFGTYPYENFSATFHPYGFGQGFPSMLMIPKADWANRGTYSFISHETSHQWWGNIVAWRSYRDQWLSEGFAEYSGVLYTAIRTKKPQESKALINNMRQFLKESPGSTVSFVGKGRLNDVGPIILGHRLDSSKAYGAYQALIYAKGALVLRMLHFLMSDPATENDREFFAMMKDFVEKYRNKAASTDDFRVVANQHFVKTPIAQRYRLTDLNWFFRQWVYNTELPSYKLDYQIEEQPDGSVFVSGNVIQEDVPDKWIMPLPVVFTFGEGKFAGSTVIAMGPKTPFKIKLPQKPSKVELDPNKWVLSAGTSTN